MVKGLSNKVSEILADGGIITDNEKEQCSYGIDIMISSITQLLCVFIISVFVGNPVETLLFFIMFIPLRIYAGGYHADSRWRCFAILIGVYIVFSGIVKINNENLYPVIILGGLIFTMLMVFMAAPVRHKHKSLTQNETCIFRKIAITICSIETAIILLGIVITGQNTYVLSCECGQLAVSLSMLAACLKKCLKGGIEDEKTL